MAANKNILLGIAALIVIVIIGFAVYTTQAPRYTPAPTRETTSEAQESTPAKEMVVTLNEQNSSGQRGTVAITEFDGKATVTLVVDGAPQGAIQPAHIHSGSCENLGAIVYPLTSPVEGESETVLDVTFDQLASQFPLAVNVHKSTEEIATYVACGDLELN